jgi:heterotetrameric sarcosine oxidase gamma subunit
MAETIVNPDAHCKRVKVRMRVPLKSADEARRVLQLGNDGATSLWIGPDQALLISDDIAAAQLVESCQRALHGMLHHAVDVSAAFACAALRGRHARSLLAMGTGVDCTHEKLQPSHCRRTRFARIAVVLHAVAADQFDLYYDRTYQHYLEQWFAHALRDPIFENDTCLNMY